MASARLQITVESACNLYNSDGVLAGKSDPYVIVEVPGQESMKFQTEVISNELNPVWNFTGEIDGIMDDDVLRFTVMDKDTFPKPDDFLGKAELTAQDFYPKGFHGELTLADSKTQATLSIMVVVTNVNEAPLELCSTDAGDGSTLLSSSSNLLYSPIPAGGGVSAGGFVINPTGPAALAPCVTMHGLPVFAPGALTTTTIPSHSMTYSAPQTYSLPQAYSAPQAPMNSMFTTSVVGSQSMASHSMARHSITYAAAEAPLPSQSVAVTGNVVVYPPVTVTAEEFAKINGTIVIEPLPVTVGVETVGGETNREVVVNTEAVDKKVKIKKKRKSQLCC